VAAFEVKNMPRYVFKNRGRGPSLNEAKAKLDQADGLTLEDQTNRELVVSGPVSSLRRFGEELEGWFTAAVHSVARPEVGSKRHRRVRRVD
jgi:hypothetical protein